jgi:protein-S-isoprenylcysteine O-methyltransferase Ste14
MLIMIVSLWCAVTLFILGFEEPTLRAKFGEDYIEYCKNVRRWIPRMTPLG